MQTIVNGTFLLFWPVMDKGIGEILRTNNVVNRNFLYIHGQGTFPDVLEINSPAPEINDGYVTTIALELVAFNSTDEFQALDLETRRCLTEEEAKQRRLNFFNSYE